MFVIIVQFTCLYETFCLKVFPFASNKQVQVMYGKALDIARISVSWEGFNISNCHVPPKTYIYGCFLWLHNLVFRWPKPLFFNMCHNFGGLMVVCCQNSSNCEFPWPEDFGGSLQFAFKQILRRIRDPFWKAGINRLISPKKRIEDQLGFLFVGVIFYGFGPWDSSASRRLHYHLASEYGTGAVSFRSHQRSESKNKKSKNHLIEFNRGCHDALDWRDEKKHLPSWEKSKQCNGMGIYIRFVWRKRLFNA